MAQVRRPRMAQQFTPHSQLSVNGCKTCLDSRHQIPRHRWRPPPHRPSNRRAEREQPSPLTISSRALPPSPRISRRLNLKFRVDRLRLHPWRLRPLNKPQCQARSGPLIHWRLCAAANMSSSTGMCPMRLLHRWNPPPHPRRLRPNPPPRLQCQSIRSMFQSPARRRQNLPHLPSRRDWTNSSADWMNSFPV